MSILKKITPLAVFTATLPFIIQGCSRAGRIENPTLRFPHLEVTLPSIEWGPAAELPDGSTFDCITEVNGHPVQLYTSPSGAPWFIDSDGHAHPVVEGDVSCPGDDNGSPSPEPINTSISSMSTHSLKYAFDESIDYASISFTIPANKTFLYRDVTQLPFLVNESTSQLINGDLAVTYDGTINDVLGALWWVGVGEISFVDSDGVIVDINWNPDVNVVTIDTSSGSDMIVMIPTNPSNWPLGN